MTARIDDDGVPPTPVLPRREALRLGALAIAAATFGALLAACGETITGSAQAGLPGAPAPAVTPWGATPSPKQPTPSPAVPPMTTRPPMTTHPSTAPELESPVPASLQPVYTLSQYVARTPGMKAFPSDSIMLTIDDGPSATWTPKILALLERYDVRATFCLIGSQVRANPALVKATAGSGHVLANHTFNHPLNLAAMSQAAVLAQIDDTQDAIVRAAGVTPHVFRSPGGAWSPSLLRQVASRRLTPIDWDIDPRDWSRPGTPQIVARMLAAKPGDVLLCHDGGGDRSQTYAALQTVLPQLKARGFHFATLPTVVR